VPCRAARLDATPRRFQAHFPAARASRSEEDLLDPDITRMRIVHPVSPQGGEVEVHRDLVYREIDGAALAMDVYVPPRLDAEERVAGVILVHGGPIPPATFGTIKNWGFFSSYGELLAATGLVGVTCNYFSRGWHDLAGSAANLAAAIDHLRRHAGGFHLDAERLALWVFSGGGPQLAPMLAAPPPYLRCLVAFYALLDLRPSAERTPEIDPATLARFSPAAQLAAPYAGPPLFVARAGLDQPWINEAADEFVRAALAAGADLELHNHAQGRHGFDLLDDTPRSREIVARSLDFLRARLASQP
jgi:acetyl esterase/lipase